MYPVARDASKNLADSGRAGRTATAAADRRVWADAYQKEFPPELFAGMEYDHREEDIFRYRYVLLDDPVHSAWLLTFFERLTFFAAVSVVEEGFAGGIPWA